MIEIVGLPATGKSHYCKASKFNCIRYHRGALIKHAHVLVYSIMHPIYAAKLLYIIISSRQNRIRDIRAVYVSFIVSIILQKRALKSDEAIVLIDEGIIHALYLIMFGAKNKDKLDDLIQNELKNHPNKIVLFDLDPDIILTNLINRHQYRLDKQIRKLNDKAGRMNLLKQEKAKYDRIIKFLNEDNILTLDVANLSSSKIDEALKKP